MTDIKDGMVGETTGVVGAVYEGSRFVIEISRPNMQFPDRVTVWKPTFQVAKGDRVTVKGEVSWRKSERNDKVYVDISINKPELIASGNAAETPPDAQPWATALPPQNDGFAPPVADYSDETPW